MELFDNRYRQEKLLGQGAFSEVWKVTDTQTGVTLALKIYSPSNGLADDGIALLTHEFTLMVDVSHKNLLRPLFYATCDRRPYLILPFCKNGNIHKMLGKMKEDQAWKLIRDTASALAYLHARRPPIIHQDIKPDNILIGDDGSYMLTDFGVSTQTKTSMSRVSNQEMSLLSAGTISYMAPERFSRNNIPIMANDIYSLGSTVYEMVSGFLPFGNDGGLLQKKGADIPELQGDFSPLLKKTLEKCLEAEPWARPTADKLEAIANEALNNPASRNTIPAELSDSPTENESTKTAASESSKETRIMTPQQMDELRKTVSASAAASGSDVAKRTVMGASSHASLDPNSLGGSYDGQPGRSHKGLIVGIVVALLVIAAGAAVWWFDPFGLKEPAQEEIVLTPEELQKADFDEALSLLSNTAADSVRAGLDKMKVLANDGYADAVYEVAFTYGWINDTESDRRKVALGWQLHNDEEFAGAPLSNDTNHEAITWMQKGIDMQVDKSYILGYYLSFYHLFGLSTERDEKKADALLNQALEEAKKSNDTFYVGKIEKTIKGLHQ